MTSDYVISHRLVRDTLYLFQTHFSLFGEKQMKMSTITLLAALALGVSTSASAATITSAAAEPAGANVLLDAIDGGSTSTLINATAAQGARGSAFNIGAGGTVDISAITIQANSGTTFTSGQNMTVAILEGTDFTGFTAGTVTPASLAAAPGITLLKSETFDMSTANGTGTVAANDFITFDFTTDLNVSGSADLSVFFFSDFAFSQREGTGNGGGRIQFRDTTTAIVGSGSRDMRFSVLGVPEPGSLALLGLGGLLIARRRRA